MQRQHGQHVEGASFLGRVLCSFYPEGGGGLRGLHRMCSQGVIVGFHRWISGNGKIGTTSLSGLGHSSWRHRWYRDQVVGQGTGFQHRGLWFQESLLLERQTQQFWGSWRFGWWLRSEGLGVVEASQRSRLSVVEVVRFVHRNQWR